MPAHRCGEMSGMVEPRALARRIVDEHVVRDAVRAGSAPLEVGTARRSSADHGVQIFKPPAAAAGRMNGRATISRGGVAAGATPARGRPDVVGGRRQQVGGAPPASGRTLRKQVERSGSSDRGAGRAGRPCRPACGRCGGEARQAAALGLVGVDREGGLRPPDAPRGTGSRQRALHPGVDDVEGQRRMHADGRMQRRRRFQAR